MKISKYLALGLLVISLTPVWGQSIGNLHTLEIGVLPQPTLDATNLTKFNLDFPGGTPAALVKAIEKATGKPLNAIIPDEDANTQLPPLKMNDVDAPQLFQALLMGSQKKETVGTGNSYSTYNTYCSFKTEVSPSDNAIWYFYAEKPTFPPVISAQKTCKFYPLAEYLNQGLTVDDITTAIQTGWKMAGIASPPELNYHKETKLLIAFGEPNDLKTIDDVLKALQPLPRDPNADFQERMSQIIKNQQDQMNSIEQNRKNSRQLPPAVLPPPPSPLQRLPVKPEVGQ